ncbi:MAG: hypothetical protein Q9175_006016 [Cornicularia normoerica]
MNTTDLKSKQYQQYLWYSRLGHLLLLRRNPEDASTAFEGFMANTVEEAEAKSFYVSCDSCKAQYNLANRFAGGTELEAVKVNWRAEIEEEWLERWGEYELQSLG